ncbi:MAG: EF-hand domain-containing protein [Desulfovibrionaceae bacterium]|nr:EF-hand domain-containing protein [Desulfovibrionaceae bacterium]
MKKLLFALALVLLMCRPAMAETNYNVCFNSLDVDLDGVMSKSEFMVAFSGGDVAEFESADTNKDGVVDHEEWEAYKEGRGYEENH